MITSYLLQFLYLFLSGLLNLLPTGSLPVQVSSAISTVWGYVNAFSYVIAVDTLIQVVIIATSFDVAVLLWSLLNWIIRKIPGMQ